VLSLEEEQQLVDWLLFMCDRGYGLSPTTLRMKVSEITTARARGLYRDNVRSFYENLQTLYSLQKYTPDCIWNCDEFDAQAGKNGGGVVIARTGAQRVHSVMPDQREWLSVLVYINGIGKTIPSFYIFRRKRFGKNYIERCEAGATMAMQPRAWMTSYLFGVWMSRFIELVQASGSISPVN
jgi:hypothetical protein